MCKGDSTERARALGQDRTERGHSTERGNSTETGQHGEGGNNTATHETLRICLSRVSEMSRFSQRDASVHICEQH